jgi:hypothetical protein
MIRPQHRSQAEINYAGAAVRIDQDVGRLDIAMSDPLFVRRLQSLTYLDTDLEDAIQGQCFTGEYLSEGLTLHVLHGEEGPPLKLTDFMNGYDIRMVQFSRRLRLSLEPGAAVSILTKRRREEFERDLAIQLSILCQIHLTHPTGTDLLDDPVVRDHSASSKSNKGFGWIVL